MVNPPMNVTLAALEVEEKLQRLVVGSSIVNVRQWLLSRFWGVGKVVIEIPDAWLKAWERKLASLEKSWKQASNGGETPKMSMITWKELQDMVQEEIVSP
jgi:hypothetical protein